MLTVTRARARVLTANIKLKRNSRYFTQAMPPDTIFVSLYCYSHCYKRSASCHTIRRPDDTPVCFSLFRFSFSERYAEDEAERRCDVDRFFWFSRDLSSSDPLRSYAPLCLSVSADLSAYLSSSLFLSSGTSTERILEMLACRLIAVKCARQCISVVARCTLRMRAQPPARTPARAVRLRRGVLRIKPLTISSRFFRASAIETKIERYLQFLNRRTKPKYLH